MAEPAKRDGQVAAHQELRRPILRATVADLDRRFAVDRKELTKGVAKVIAGGSLFALGGSVVLPNVVATVVDGAGGLLASFRRERTVEGRLWALVRESLDLAWLAVARAALAGRDYVLNEDKLASAVATSLDAAIQHEMVEVGAELFERPEELAILAKARDGLVVWLRGFERTAPEAEVAAADLPACFVAALRAVWARQPEAFAGVAARVETPFDLADERQRGWFAYRCYLEAELSRPLFDGPCSLRELYQPLRAYRLTKRDDPDTDALSARRREVARYREVREVVDAEGELDRWLAEAGPDDALRVVCGGPGAGKSSLARWWVAKLAARAEGPRALLVPLHRLVGGELDLAAMVDRFAAEATPLRHRPLDRREGERRLVLFLDGLDELAMRGASGREAAEVLLGQTRELLRTHNEGGRRLWAVLGGREVLVDTLKVQLPLRAVLHLLPYKLGEEARRVCEWSDPQQLLDTDQRKDWWQAWGRATGEPLVGAPAALDDSPQLAELSEQPLLNFLLALARQSGLELTEATGLNDVYARLFHEVWARRWGEQGRLEAHRGIDEATFGRLFEAIALAAWHSGGARAVTTAAVKEAIAREGLEEERQRLEQEAERGSLRLLTAFYFREAGKGSREERAWEFTHKSFGEYLVARRLVRQIERTDKLRRKNKRHRDEGWNETRALVEWVTVTGPVPIDMGLLTFLRGEVARRGLTKAAAWQGTLAELMGFQLANGLPLEETSLDLRTFREMVRQGRNAEEALLCTLASCAVITKRTSHVNWPESNIREVIARNVFMVSAGYAIDRLNCNYLFPDMSRFYLQFLNLNLQFLEYRDFGGFNLIGVDFSMAFLNRVNLGGAKLSGAKLGRAYLGWADLRGADLRGADLRGATLTGADLTRADLTGADLTGADLRDTKGLTREQLKAAITTSTTELPEDLPYD